MWSSQGSAQKGQTALAAYYGLCDVKAGRSGVLLAQTCPKYTIILVVSLKAAEHCLLLKRPSCCGAGGGQGALTGP